MSAFYASVNALPTPIWCCLVICGVGLVLAGCVAMLTWWENRTSPIYRAPDRDPEFHMRDQVRADMQRRLRSIPTNQKGQR